MSHSNICRSWRSTLAEGVETQYVAPPSNSKVDSLMNTVERYMRQFGRISRKQLDPIVASLDKEGQKLDHMLFTFY